MNCCGMVIMTVSPLQKLWCGHNGCVLQKFNGDGLSFYWDGLLLQCTACVSDGFALVLGDQNPFRPCFHQIFDSFL